MTAIGTSINLEQLGQRRQQLTSSPEALLRHTLHKYAQVVDALDSKVKLALGGALKSGDDDTIKLAIEVILCAVQDSMEPIRSSSLYCVDNISWEENHDMFTGQFFGFGPA